MPAVSFGGLASGLDTNSIVSQLVAAERTPIRQMQTKQQNTRAQLNLLQSIQSKLSSLRGKATSLDAASDLELLKGSSANADRVTVSVAAGASVSKYSIDNVVLATGQKNRSRLFDAKTEIVGTGVLSIVQGGTAHNITLDSSNNTLEGLVAAINAKEGLAVSASLFFDGSRYRVLMSSEGTGAAASYTVDESGMSGAAALDFAGSGNVLSSAANGSFQLDGQTVTMAENTVTGVLPGVTFTFKAGFSSSPTEVKVENDLDGMVARVKDLVSSYNTAATAVRDQFVVGAGQKPNPQTTLFGDSTLRAVQGGLALAVSAPVAGLPVGKNSFADAGVTLDRTGNLVLDETKLRSALSQDRQAVARIFGTDGATTGAVGRLVTTLDEYLDSSKGLLEAKEATFNTRITQLDERIAAAERRITGFEQNLRNQFTALERVMSQLQSQGNFMAQQVAAWSR